MNGSRSLKLTGLFLLVMFGGALVAAACTGSAGPAGAPGLPGAAGLPGNSGAPGKPGLPGVQGLAGAAGDVGAIGDAGEQGPPGPSTAAGISVDKAGYVVGQDRGLTVSGWGFAANEAVLITLYASGVPGFVVVGGEADAVGLFELKSGSRTRLDRVTGLEAGLAYVAAEGSSGSKASASVLFTEEAK